MSDESLNAFADQYGMDEDEIILTQIFKEPIIPGEVPEIRDDIAVVAQTVSALEDLQYLYEDVRKEGGMSRTFAMEAQRLIPDFDGKRSLNFYTEVPTATRYKASLEGIGFGIFAAITAAVGVVLGLLYKLIRWILNRGDKSDKGKAVNPQQAAKEVKEEVKEQQAEIKQVQEAMAVNVKDFNELNRIANDGVQLYIIGKGIVTYTDLEEMFMVGISEMGAKKEILGFVHNPDAISYDIMVEGEYVQSMRSLVDGLKQLEGFVNARMDLMRVVIEYDIRSDYIEDKLKNDQRLKTLKKRLQINVRGKMVDIRDMTNDVLRIRTSLSNRNVKSELGFMGTMDAMGRTENNPLYYELPTTYENLAAGVLSTSEMAQKIDNVLGDVTTDNADGAVQHEVATQLREVLRTIREDIMDYEAAILEVKRFHTYYLEAEARTLAYLLAGIRQIRRMMIHGENKDTAPSFYRAVSAIVQEREKEQFYKLFRNFPKAMKL